MPEKCHPCTWTILLPMYLDYTPITPNNTIQRSCSTCDARTIGDETGSTVRSTAGKISADRGGREDRRGIGALQSP
jgi:hypothetical protein